MDILNLFNTAAALARTAAENRAQLYNDLGGLKFPLWLACDSLKLPKQHVEPLLTQMVNDGLLELTIGKVLDVYSFKRAP
jgi:hypothetical protein